MSNIVASHSVPSRRHTAMPRNSRQPSPRARRPPPRAALREPKLNRSCGPRHAQGKQAALREPRLNRSCGRSHTQGKQAALREPKLYRSRGPRLTRGRHPTTSITHQAGWRGPHKTSRCGDPPPGWGLRGSTSSPQESLLPQLGLPASHHRPGSQPRHLQSLASSPSSPTP